MDTYIYTDYKTQDMENNLDPENNPFSSNNSCSYYTENQYNPEIK